MKCKYCGYEAPVIAGDEISEEFISSTVDEKTGWIEPILKCPKCGREQD